MIPRRPSLRSVVFALVVLASFERVGANTAAPLQPGAMFGEPQAELSGLAIERERLTLDLRPLANDPETGAGNAETDGRALVSALYDVRNDGAERVVALEFIAQAIDTAQWAVVVDGRRIPALYRAGGTAGYAVPATTPGLDGRPLRYDADAAGILHFDALIGPGRHTIRVEYVARVTRQVLDHPLVHWQLAYILAPARSWPSFGTLDVSVLVPATWSVATAPALERRGETLVGRFEEIPADALTITARAVYAWWYPVVAWAPAALALVIGGIAAWRLGRAHGRRLARAGRGPLWALPGAFGAAFVLGVAVPVAGLAGAAIEESLVGPGQGAWGSYSFFFAEVLLAIGAFIVALALVQTSAVLAIRRIRRRYDARWADAYVTPDGENMPRAIHTNGTTHQQHP